MYVINRKRISLILICLLLGIFAYSYEGTKISLDDEIQETTSTPVSGKVIVVDAGHGVPDERDNSLFVYIVLWFSKEFYFINTWYNFR